MELPSRADFKSAIIDLLRSGPLQVQAVYEALAERFSLTEAQLAAKRAGQVHYQHEARFAKLDLIHEGIVERPERAGRGTWRLVDGLAGDPAALPNEVSDSVRLAEGATQTVTVNRYERSEQGRKAAIAHHGCRCIVCGFDFLKAFGPFGNGVIHVHHLVPLSEVREAYELDPVKDLIPICPNCHAMAHRREPPFTPAELQEMLRSAAAG